MNEIILSESILNKSNFNKPVQVKQVYRLHIVYRLYREFML